MAQQKLQGFKITNKATTASMFVEAMSEDEALNLFAKQHSNEGSTFSKATYDNGAGARNETLSKSLIEVRQVYWKSEDVRGRFSTKGKAVEACMVKGVKPDTVHLYLV